LHYLISDILYIAGLCRIVLVVFYFVKQPSDRIGIVLDIRLDELIARVITLFLANFPLSHISNDRSGLVAPVISFG
jgi:hypothetical protein